MAKSVAPPRRKPRFRERNAVTAPARPSRAALAPDSAVLSRPTSALPVRRVQLAAWPRWTLEQALYVVIIVLGFTVRIWDLGSRAMHGDEAVHAWLAWNLYNGTGYQYDPVYHGPLQFPVTALFYFLFGPSNTSGRLMAVLFGTALIALPYFLRLELGRGAALLSAAFIAFTPAFVYVSRIERDDIFTSLFALTTAIAIFGYVRTRRVRFIYLGAASLALSLTAMENTYITAFVFGTFIGIVVVTQLLARTSAGALLESVWRRTGSSDRIAIWLVSGVLAALLLALVVTVITGLYAPVPLVLAVMLVGLIHRQALLGASEGAPSFLAGLRSIRGQTWLNAMTVAIGILFLFFSTFGTNMHGIWDSGQSFLNNGTACPGNDFPLNPCRKDIIGGLFYWLSQHKVARGGQPWFYYPLLYGLYQQIAVVFGLGGIIWFLRKPTLFTAFLTYWAVLMFGIYSWAGEKFPWLTIHPLLPFLLLAAMFVAELLRRPGIVRYLALAVFALLGGLELHNSFELNFVNAVDPVEMFVYVQSAPDTPKVAQSIQAISNKVTNGNDLHATIDNNDTWPFAWYLRDYSNIAYPNATQLLQKPYSTNPVIIVDESHQAALLPQLKQYSGHRYTLRWWFPEDYKSLTWRSLWNDAINPSYWSVIARWQLERRPFGPRQTVNFYYYVKNGLVSPY